jgi:hypothetical protein
MTKKMIFVSRVGSSLFIYFFMNDLLLNDMTFVLSVDIDANVSIKTNIKYAKLLILRKKVTEGAYLKFVQNFRTIFLKLETQGLNSNKIKT